MGYYQDAKNAGNGPIRGQEMNESLLLETRIILDR
jgi:hypothetical protein